MRFRLKSQHAFLQLHLAFTAENIDQMDIGDGAIMTESILDVMTKALNIHITNVIRLRE